MVPRKQAEHVAAPTNACKSEDSLPTWSRPNMAKPDLGHSVAMSAFGEGGVIPIADVGGGIHITVAPVF
jgi:hypothetical protein